MIDWRLANTVAQAVAAVPPAADAGGTAAELEAFAVRSAQAVADYTGLAGADQVPAPETIDRPQWVEANLGSMRTILDPVAARAGEGFGPIGPAVRVVAGLFLALEVGAISGFLAGRVLGQYEFPILDPAAPARLLFVGPNLATAARTLDTDQPGLLRWVALHETTHALQFSGVPWLRSHMAGRLRALIDSLDVKIDPRAVAKLPTADDLRALAETVRKGGLAALVVGPERRALLDEVQATMALIEGYAEHVMDAAGAPLLPDVDRLRGAMERRRRDRSGLFRLVERLIGMDLKMRQYELGKRFCDAVVTEAGIEGLNRAWASPAALPSLAELETPSAWLARVGA